MQVTVDLIWSVNPKAEISGTSLLKTLPGITSAKIKQLFGVILYIKQNTMRYIPTNQENASGDKYDAFFSNFAKLVLSQFTEYEKMFAGLDEEEIIDMVSEHQNEYGEYDTKYPQFKQSIQSMYEHDFTVLEAYSALIDGIKELIYGNLSAM